MAHPSQRAPLGYSLLRWVAAGMVALGVTSACGDEALPGAASHGDGGPPPVCVDLDGDGFGSGCPDGSDCDDEDPNTTDECYRCNSPNEGCTCPTPGQTVDCGVKSSQVGDIVNCVMGTRTCNGGVWGACSADTMESKSTKAVGTTPGGCSNNPCDPYCKHFDNTTPPTLGTGTGTNPGGGIVLTPTGGSPTPPPSCGSTPQSATRIPLGMVLMVDRSGSMTSPASKWTNLKSALSTFVTSSGMDGSETGLDFFPPPASGDFSPSFTPLPGITGDQCNAANYNNPNLTVPIALLPGAGNAQRTALNNAVTRINSGGGTPMVSALNGALIASFNWANAVAGRKGIVVLVTDGLPTDCGNCGGKKGKSAKNEAACRVQEVANLAEAFYYGTPSVETFVVGIDDAAGSNNLKYLNAIARAGSGGTRNATVINGGSSATIVNALNAIRDVSLTCDFAVPAPPAGAVVDPASAVVSITSGATTTSIPKVNAPGLCGAGQGFYYDLTLNKIVLCPTSCTLAKGDLNASISITYSCLNACTGGSAQGTPGPLDLFMVLDRSGSMDTETDGVALWQAATGAIRNFVANKGNVGVGFGINFFPTANGCDKCRICTGGSLFGACLGWSDAPYPVCPDRPSASCPPSTAAAPYIYYSNENTGNSCTASTYATPTSIQGLNIATITTGGTSDPVVASVFQRLREVIPSGGTPTRPALEGSLSYVATHKASNPTRKHVAVLVTDGLPTGCTTNSVANVATVASTNYAAGIDTYVVGVGAEPCTTNADCSGGATCDTTRGVCQGGSALANLDTVALSGSGNKYKAFMVKLGQPEGFLDAMNTIRRLSTPCNFVIPAAPGGGSLDYANSQVIVTSRCPSSGACTLAASASATTLTQVANAAACGSGASFYYDNPAAPTQVIMCPQACGMVQQDPYGRLDVVYQCLQLYNNGTVNLEYDVSNVCPAGFYSYWGNWSWQTTTPTTTKVSFNVLTGQRNDSTGVITNLTATTPMRFTKTGLDSVAYPALGKPVCASLPNVCDAAVATNTQNGGQLVSSRGDAVVDRTFELNGLQRNYDYLRVDVNLYTSTDQKQTPILQNWDLEVTCKPGE